MLEPEAQQLVGDIGGRDALGNVSSTALISIAISMKRIADFVAGTEERSDIVQYALDAARQYGMTGR